MLKPFLINLLRKIPDCVKYGDFILSSGIKSNVYCDLRKVLYNPVYRKIVLGFFNENQFENVEQIGGMGYGGLPLVISVSDKLVIPSFMYREPKNHGTAKSIEGCFTPGATTVLIEDVVSTAGSILKCYEAIKDQCKVKAVYCVLNRKLGGDKAITDLGLQFQSLLEINDLLPGG